jgi:hypothetical protein
MCFLFVKQTCIIPKLNSNSHQSPRKIGWDSIPSKSFKVFFAHCHCQKSFRVTQKYSWVLFIEKVTLGEQSISKMIMKYKLFVIICNPRMIIFRYYTLVTRWEFLRMINHVLQTFITSFCMFHKQVFFPYEAQTSIIKHGN